MSAGEGSARLMEMGLHYCDIPCELITIHIEGEESIMLGPDGGEE